MPINEALIEYYPTIKELPEGERPRERLEHYGPAALSTAELLAIILRVGTKDENVIRLAQRLLVGLRRAGRAGAGALQRIDRGQGAGSGQDHAAQGRVRAGTAAVGGCAA